MKKKIIIPLVLLVVIIVVVGLILFFNTHQEVETRYELPNIGVINNLGYEINPNETIPEDQLDQRYRKDVGTGKGYIIDTFNYPDAPYFYLITMGERPTGGYSINIVDIKVDDSKNVEVKVNEKSPKNGEIVTEAFTYPFILLKLEHAPNSIKIVNQKNEEYKCLNC